MQVNIAKFVNCATRLLAELDRFFCKSSTIDVVWYPVRNLLNFSIFLHLSRITCCAIPSILRATFKIQALLSQQVTQHYRFCFQMLGGSGSSVGVLWSSFRTSFLVPEAELSDVSCCCCCCCCCDCQALLSTIFGQDEASRVFHIKFFLPFEKPLCRCNLPAQSCTQLWHEILAAKTAIPLSCARAKLIPETVSTCCDSVFFSSSRGHR